MSSVVSAAVGRSPGYIEMQGRCAQQTLWKVGQVSWTQLPQVLAGKTDNNFLGKIRWGEKWGRSVERSGLGRKKREESKLSDAKGIWNIEFGVET